MKNRMDFFKSLLIIVLSVLLIVSIIQIMNARTAAVRKQQQRSEDLAEIKTAMSEFVEHSDLILTKLEEIQIPDNKTTLVPTEDTGSSTTESDAPNNAKFSIGEQVPIPTLPTHVKLCTDYRCYNLTYTPHYRLQQTAYTDEHGLRKFNEDYIVGLGAFYSTDIGDRFKVTLDTGKEFTIILGDGKAPIDCDDGNMYTPCKDYNGNDCANVLEFIIDSDVMSSQVYAYGSIDCIPEFSGNIAKMEYLGRDNSADWSTYE